MPRRNNTPKQPPRPTTPVVSKKRYISKQAALLAVSDIQRYDPDLKLDVYQSNGGWYLTSRQSRL